MELIKLDDVNSKIIILRNERVILDSDVAVLYGVETKRVNEAIKNNPDKFPVGYLFELDTKEIRDLRSKNSTTNLMMTRVAPKAFTKKGCYMLATILKSPKATQATIDIIEAFEKMQELSQSIVELMKDHENEQKQQTLAKKGEELFSEIIGNALDTVDTETSFELNLAAFKIKHTVKRSKQAQ
jgi:phage regulator Rha-like protein